MIEETVLLMSAIIGFLSLFVGFILCAVEIHKQKRGLERLERNQERLADMWRLHLKHGMGMDTYDGVTQLLEELEREDDAQA